MKTANPVLKGGVLKKKRAKVQLPGEHLVAQPGRTPLKVVMLGVLRSQVSLVLSAGVLQTPCKRKKVNQDPKGGGQRRKRQKLRLSGEHQLTQLQTTHPKVLVNGTQRSQLGLAVHSAGVLRQTPHKRTKAHWGPKGGVPKKKRQKLSLPGEHQLIRL